jgi:uncharacterized protein
MRVFHNITVGLDEDLEEKLAWLMPGYSSHRILKQSVDARQRHNPHFVYSVELYGTGEAVPKKEILVNKIAYKGPKPIIIGAGPAGLFAALRFVERGVACHVFERGSVSEKRMTHINRFWRYGELSPNNNVCFGEGGAGLYSDGKLITRIKSPYIAYVMNRLVQFGAPKEIEFLANPHVGSDRIRRVIPLMREFLQSHGVEFHYDSPVTKLLTDGSQISGVEIANGETFHTDKVILATGHSAEDVFKHLHELGVYMEGKSFAVGLRIEHPQTLINSIQYRGAAHNEKLGAANYRLAHHDSSTDTGVYSFCMCPGGYVLSSGTEADGVVVNGMSNYKRNSPFANSAIVVTVDHAKSFGADNLWGGLEFRRDLEHRSFMMVQEAGGTKEIPVQKLTDFLAGKKSTSTLPTSSPSHAVAAPLHELLPASLHEHFHKGLEAFGQQMRGFISADAQLHAVESRTSCPIRVTRNSETLQSLSHKGLYPCGEGAGYAGGITSAACDGIRIVEKILEDQILEREPPTVERALTLGADAEVEI